MSYKGIVWSKEALENRAKSLRGLKRTPEQRRRIALGRMGIKPSKEAIAQRTKTRRKNGWNKNPEETKKRMSLNSAHAMLGRKHSIESRLKTSAALVGPKNHNWRGGISDEHDRVRKSLQYHLWRDDVLKRDNFTCQFCGKRGGKLQADHIKPFALFKELRFNLENGRTLCIPCHQKTDTHGYRKMYRKPKTV